MNKRLKLLTCAVAVTFSLSLALTSVNIGPFGADVVSAASETTSTTPTTTTSTSTSTKTSSSSTSTSYSSSSSISGLLRFGSTGSAVKTLQANLNKYLYQLKVDGIFGNQTLIAVKKFQAAHGLVVDGIVGPLTLAKLIPTTATNTVAPTTILRFGNTGNDVKILQTYLNKFLYALKVDGIFGNQTLIAVRKFQASHGLVVDGLAGPLTFAKLTAKPVVKPVVKPVTPPDVVTTASIVNTNEAFKSAIGTQGKWIIGTLKDLTFTEPLRLDGQFLNGKTDATGLKTLQRKIALYTQDANRNVTASFTLKAPSLTIMSANASIEHGTFIGDLIVSVPDFQLKYTKVIGNVYFTTKAAQETFKMTNSSVTGEQKLKMPAEVDAVTTASLVDSNSAFESAISKTGKWIITTLNNLTFTKDLLVDGDLYNTKNPPALARKIGLYTQDANHIVTSRFTLKAPSITINSTNGSIEHGTFKGDVYVTAPGFQLKDAVIDGNLYFATQALKDAFKLGTATAPTAAVPANGTTAAVPAKPGNTASIVTGSIAVKTVEQTAIKIGRAEFAAHGTKCFSVAVVAMAGDKIVGASVDDYQFVAPTGGFVGVPNSDKDFGLNYPTGKVLISKLTNTVPYSTNMMAEGATLTWVANMTGIETFVKGKTIAEVQAVIDANKTADVDAVSSATFVDTNGYLKAIVAAAKDAKENTSTTVATSQLSNLKMGRAEYAAHGTKCFTVAVAATLADKIVATSIDDYQFTAPTGGFVGVPNSDKDFGLNYPVGKVLISKRTNTVPYSTKMMAEGATLTWIANATGVEKYATGKSITELDAAINANKNADGTDKDATADAVSSATFVNTNGYLSSIEQAAKAAK